MQRGRRMAFDYGDVRIGVAVSDRDSILVTPLAALSAQSPTLIDEIRALIEEYEPIVLVVGEPRHLSGRASSTMESVERFLLQLQSITNTPIRLVDERLSTVSAAGKLRAAGKDAKSSKSLIDSAAAAEILESAINAERHSGPLDEE
jgi:putative Holliday junction resolvase